MDETLNVAFFVFHSGWIVFTCSGWAFGRTRRWHLATVAVTAFSWFVLGIWFGWGYCPFTDWHWQTRERLGYQDPHSYIQVLGQEIVGVEIERMWADAAAMVTLTIVTALTVVLNTRDFRRNRLG
jgi:uncharacterized protein DUF2784